MPYVPKILRRKSKFTLILRAKAGTDKELGSGRNISGLFDIGRENFALLGSLGKLSRFDLALKYILEHIGPASVLKSRQGQYDTIQKTGISSLQDQLDPADGIYHPPIDQSRVERARKVVLSVC